MVALRAINMFPLMILVACDGGCTKSPEPTKASQSSYESDFLSATTSSGLTKADLAWHALNTFGWDCSEVISRGEMQKEGYYIIDCSSGTRLRVYPRNGKHPSIRNEQGGYN